MEVSCSASLPHIYNSTSLTHVVGRYTEPLHYLETRSKASSPHNFKSCLNALSLLPPLLIFDRPPGSFRPILTSLLLLLHLLLLLLLLLPPSLPLPPLLLL